MKKLLLRVTLFSFPILASLSTLACDICGCSTNSYYLGLLPEFRKHFVGLRYIRQSYHYGYESIIVQPGAVTYDAQTDQTLQLNAGWQLGQRFRIMAFVPYQMKTLEGGSANGAVKQDKNGLGDINLTGWYQILKSDHTTEQHRRLIQALYLGAGIKLPTGNYDPQSPTLPQLNSFQMGSGSVDFSALAMYDIRLQDFGFNTSVAYFINTSNSDDFRYGNRLALSSLLYYRMRLEKKMQLTVSGGIRYEHSEADRMQGNKYEETASFSLMPSAGLDLQWGRVGLGVNYQHAHKHHHDMGLDPESRLTTQLIFSF